MLKLRSSLLVFLLTSAAYVGFKWDARQHLADGCDSFGYLRLAQVLRQGWNLGEWPQYVVRDAQTPDLVKAIEGSGQFLFNDWYQAIAPHAHFYQPAVQAIGIQYPPGAGLVLALFPEASSVRLLNQSLVLVFLLFGLCLLWKARNDEGLLVRRVPLLIAVAATFILSDTSKHYSYSIQTSMLPLVLSLLALMRARFLEQNRNGMIVVAAAGFALAALCRIPILFHGVGCLLLCPKEYRVKFLLALGLFFVPILAIYNTHVTGFPWKFTYSSIDSAPPNAAVILKNISYYFFGGGNQFLWAVLLVGGLAYHILRNDRESRSQWAWVLLGWVGAPLVYFLTHTIKWSYYMHPTWLGAVWITAGFAAFSRSTVLDHAAQKMAHTGRLRCLQVLLLVVSCFFVSQIALNKRKFDPPPLDTSVHLPPEHQDILSSPQAWIWSDYNSGSFLYFYGKIARKMNFADEKFREWTLKWILGRKDRLYVLDDSVENTRIIQELGRRPDLKVEVIGSLFSKPLYSIKAAEY
jgi:hypothetical protein